MPAHDAARSRLSLAVQDEDEHAGRVSSALLAWAEADDGALLQVTRDHTLIQALMDAGSITEEEALVHPQRSAVYAALHGSPEDLAGLEVSWLDVAVGDRLLVCSDGLSGALAPQTIADLLDEAEDIINLAAPDILSDFEKKNRKRRIFRRKKKKK